jgi:hypothetical protein
MFLKIDDWFFDKVFQPFADWFCDQTNRNPLYLASISGYLFVSGIVVEHTIFPHSVIYNIIAGLICTYIAIRSSFHNQRSHAPSKKSPFMNPYRVDKFFFFLRMFLIINLPFDIYSVIVHDVGNGKTHSDVLELFKSVTFISFLYFEACEAKPPAPPKKKESLYTRSAHSAS